MTKLDMLVENQNLRKMLEVMREDIDKNCVECENMLPHIIRYVTDCERCVFIKYRKDEKVEKPKPFTIKPLECEV